MLGESKVGIAEPVDGAVAPNQGDCMKVPYDSIIFYWEVSHGFIPPYLLHKANSDQK